jgi:leucyl-tRNA synthetase
MEAGLVTRKGSEVNWDPVDMTVLANEQVIDGRGWRSGARSSARSCPQWFLKITDFAEELLQGLGSLDEWPDKVRLMQENWIGKSQGLQFCFRLATSLPAAPATSKYSRPARHDFRASFVAISPGHPIAEQLAAIGPRLPNSSPRRGPAGPARRKSRPPRSWASIPAGSGSSVRRELAAPVWIANFVLMDYGTGASTACPAMTSRLMSSRRKYRLPILPRRRRQARRASAPSPKRNRRRRGGQFADSSTACHRRRRRRK